MSSVSRAFSFLRASVRPQVVPRASITSKPAKHALTAGEQAIGLTMMFVTILVPSGWILMHLEDYKKRA
ncbi:cytochrome c oxidase subunit 8B, mitochondrial [Electrophorus electricus]|uniref:Uncharacterized protein n=1 Tax=Electrophorus electricus TaxID=8005 RepID=A0A4W4GMH2_ELEEL|nr:cytochrome c oxidase subunit 8B, mitochondrial [Electrophorus electricus]